MSLDDRLQEVLTSDDFYGRTDNEQSENKAIAQIKQAFADEGYRRYVAKDSPMHKEMILMTGQEWYERFKKEYRHVPSGKGYAATRNVIAAAKRAAGIDEARQV